MKKLLIIAPMLTLVFSCSSNKTGHAPTDAVIEHMSKGKKAMGNDFDSKFQKEGFINGDYVAISSSKSDINANETAFRVQIEADARARLLQTAPTDFKNVIQRAISSTSNDNGSAEAINITVTEVRSLTGLKSNFDDFQCVTFATPNVSLTYDYEKECRAIMRIPASNLMKAYKYTLDKKYGVNESQLQDILKEQIKQEIVRPVSKNETANVVDSSVKN